MNSNPRALIHLLVFLVFLSLWTWKLLEAYPVSEEISDELEKAGLSFAAAKSLHAGGYAFLTVLAATMPVERRGRIFLVGFLILHGVATEIGQTYVPNRFGSVRDVLIDWGGIALGLLALRLWRWRRSAFNRTASH